MRWRAPALLLLLALTLGVPAPRAQAALINTPQEIALGRDAAQELEDRFGVVQDAAQTRRLSAIGARLAAGPRPAGPPAGAARPGGGGPAAPSPRSPPSPAASPPAARGWRRSPTGGTCR